MSLVFLCYPEKEYLDRHILYVHEVLTYSKLQNEMGQDYFDIKYIWP